MNDLYSGRVVAFDEAAVIGQTGRQFQAVPSGGHDLDRDVMFGHGFGEELLGGLRNARDLD